jgi:hypothetical protein
VAARGSRGGLPILLGVAAGLALCALAYFALTFAAPQATLAPDPAPTARAICADLSGQHYDTLYALLTPDLQRQGTEAQFAASQRELDSLLGAVHGCQASVTTNGGGAAAITLRLQRGQTPAAGAHLALAQTQGGAWRIASYDQNV